MSARFAPRRDAAGAAARSSSADLFTGLARHRGARPAGLSGGLQQQLALARFGMSSPRVWLLDDPLQGLDEETTGRVLDWIRTAAEAGAAVILTGQHIRTLLGVGDEGDVSRRGLPLADSRRRRGPLGSARSRSCSDPCRRKSHIVRRTMSEPDVNSTASAHFKVAPSDLASALNLEPEDAFPPVFATSRMVALMELAAAARVLGPICAAGELSVGVSLDVVHTAATPPGATVTATAKFLGREGKLFVFELLGDGRRGRDRQRHAQTGGRHRPRGSSQARLAVERRPDASFTTFEILGRHLEYRWIGPRPGDAPSIVFLHEGLGCVGMWRDFPDRLASATGCGALVYSRMGHGGSDPVSGPRPVRYLHDEALEVLPAVLEHFELGKVVLFGHSDGASIAIIHAGSGGSPSPELRSRARSSRRRTSSSSPSASKGSRESTADYETTRLRERLARYHGDNTDSMFRAWSDVWLRPEFREWNIEEYLPAIESRARRPGRRRRVRHREAGRGRREGGPRPGPIAGPPACAATPRTPSGPTRCSRPRAGSSGRVPVRVGQPV